MTAHNLGSDNSHVPLPSPPVSTGPDLATLKRRRFKPRSFFKQRSVHVDEQTWEQTSAAEVTPCPVKSTKRADAVMAFSAIEQPRSARTLDDEQVGKDRRHIHFAVPDGEKEKKRKHHKDSDDDEKRQKKHKTPTHAEPHQRQPTYQKHQETGLGSTEAINSPHHVTTIPTSPEEEILETQLERHENMQDCPTQAQQLLEQTAFVQSTETRQFALEILHSIRIEQKVLQEQCEAMEDMTSKLYKTRFKLDVLRIDTLKMLTSHASGLCLRFFMEEFAFRDILDENKHNPKFAFKPCVEKFIADVRDLVRVYDEQVDAVYSKVQNGNQMRRVIEAERDDEVKKLRSSRERTVQDNRR